MKPKENKIIKALLREEIGRYWPIFLVKCMIEKKKIFQSTPWAKENSLEAKFVKRLSLSCALYFKLQKKFDKQKSFEIMKKIIIPISLIEMNQLKIELPEKDSMESLLAFFVFIGIQGVGRFVKRKIVKANNTLLEYQVKNCIFVRFFNEVGTPELAKLFCEVDEVFFPKAFPDFKFYRGDSFKNTEAYGKDCCRFIFEKVNAFQQ
jgi:hypothetical protein